MNKAQQEAKRDSRVLKERVEAAIEGLESLSAPHLDMYLQPARVELHRMLIELGNRFVVKDTFAHTVITPAWETGELPPGLGFVGPVGPIEPVVVDQVDSPLVKAIEDRARAHKWREEPLVPVEDACALDAGGDCCYQRRGHEGLHDYEIPMRNRTGSFADPPETAEEYLEEDDPDDMNSICAEEHEKGKL